jgi:hypothetical protein
MGNYQVVLSLLSSIEHGKETKALVDTLIDNCESSMKRYHRCSDLVSTYR